MKNFGNLLSKLALLTVVTLFLAACDDLEGLDPIIAEFSAEPDSISAGEETTLSWRVVGGAPDLTVTLTPGDEEVEKSGELTLTPAETTTYTLSAGTATKSVEVIVDGNDDGGGEDTGSEDTGGEDTGGDDAGDDDGADDGGTDGGTDDGGDDGGEDPNTDCPDVVEIPDAGLKDIIKEALGTTDDDISCEQMRSLTELEIINSTEPIPGIPNPPAIIEDLTGLEYAINLVDLTVSNIIDNPDEALELSFLENMSELETLSLNADTYNDLSPLTNLSSLRSLSFAFANFDDEADLSVIGTLETLENLAFAEGGTIDITAFADAPSLERLSFNAVEISDFDAISEFTNLSYFAYFTIDEIDDISALLDLPWEGSDDTVYLRDGSFDNVPDEQFEALEQKVENVVVSNRSPAPPPLP